MEEIKHIVFVEEHGNERAIMAKAIFDEGNKNKDIHCDARGITVLFPEPINRKVEAILAGNGIEVSDFSSKALSKEDFTNNTLVLAMSEVQKNRIIEKFPECKNVQVLTDMTRDELEIMDPYGGTLQAYGLCFESMSLTIKKLLMLVSKGDKENG